MTDDEDTPSVRAGEYVLGTLSIAEMRAVEAEAAQDPALAREIAFWEDRLAPLSSLVPPVQPPPVLWSRLALATGLGAVPRRGTGTRVWQGATFAALALAAGFAFLAFLPRPPEPPAPGALFAAALAPMGTPAQFLVEARTDGSLTLTRLTGTAPASGRDFQLWSLPKGATRPVSLGVIGAAPRPINPAERPTADTQLLVSDEPAGGSPTGQPTGKVLYGGALTPLSPPP